MRLAGFAGSPPGSDAWKGSMDGGQPTLGGRCQAPYVYTEAGITVALTGGPIWYARELLADPARSVLAAYRSKGRAVLAELAGRFSLAIVDRNADCTLLAVDPMGIERLVYRTFSGGIAFASTVADLAGVSEQPGVLRPQALFDYMLLHMVPAPNTVYEGVSKLRAGTCAIFQRSELRVERCWVPNFAARADQPVSVLRDELRDSLRLAVADCRPDARTGAFLSGGLDSSTVAGMLGLVSGRPPKTFSIGFGVDAYNELEYAHISNRAFGAIAHEYNVTADDIIDAFPRIAAAYDEPFGNSSAVPTYFCAKLAAGNGIGHLLAGDGGDEVFGGNERYARHRLFEAYGAFPRTLRAGIVEPLLARVPTDSRLVPLRKLRSYVDQARIPLPERLESWNFMYRTDLSAMLEPEFHAAIDTRAPLRDMAEVYSSAPSRSLLDRMLYFDWHYTLSDNDLRKVGTMCELAGVRVSYPMLDPRVIELSLRVPASLKMRGLELRSFYKRAMRGFLPEAVIAKKKHGFGLPFGVWLKTHARLGDYIRELLNGLKRRRIVRGAFLDDLMAQHRDGHASYFGYAIWDLAMLEAWLQAAGRSAATVPR
jgi:asparagine synthase (glutamine-hydrolysing)